MYGEYSWQKFDTTKQGHLDYFLISEDLMSEVNSARVEHSNGSDRSLVMLSLKTEAFKRDQPFWKFKNSLLQDKMSVNEIKKLILKIKKTVCSTSI